MEARERRIRQKLKSNFQHFSKRCLKIRTKSGEQQPLVLNTAQRYLHQRLEQQLAEFGRVRALVLKGRQQGISTYVEGRLYWRVTTNKGVRAYILTHEREATTNLFDMVQRYHDHCPPLVKPISGKTNAKELLFDRLDSGYKVGTAGAKGTGRSSTIQYFHGSEVAFWPHAESHQSGVMQAIPDEPGTEEILESTANGVGGVFHGLWEESERGQNEYEPIFIPWYWQPEYRRDARDLIMDPEERELAKLYRLDPEQIAWRRARIAKLKSLDLFHQEYPCNAKEAFLYSGRPVFMPAWLDKAEQECFRPKYLGEIRLGTDTIDKRKDGALSVWFECAYGDKYVIGADVAEGVVKGDYSSADVLRVRDGLQVAQWHGKVDPDQYASILAFLGKRYNKALVGVERNNHGLTTLTSLRNLGYSNVYTQRDIEQRSEGKELKKFGWLTTQKSKIKIIDQLSAELRDREHGIVSRETIDEMRTFVIEDNGSYGAKPGCFDDRVMSRAIAGEMLRAVPKGWRA